jgi:hypothetical protein
MKCTRNASVCSCCGSSSIRVSDGFLKCGEFPWDFARTHDYRQFLQRRSCRSHPKWCNRHAAGATTKGTSQRRIRPSCRESQARRAMRARTKENNGGREKRRKATRRNTGVPRQSHNSPMAPHNRARYAGEHRGFAMRLTIAVVAGLTATISPLVRTFSLFGSSQRARHRNGWWGSFSVTGLLTAIQIQYEA